MSFNHSKTSFDLEYGSYTSRSGLTVSTQVTTISCIVIGIVFPCVIYMEDTWSFTVHINWIILSH